MDISNSSSSPKQSNEKEKPRYKNNKIAHKYCGKTKRINEENNPKNDKEQIFKNFQTERKF